jgi:transposase
MADGVYFAGIDVGSEHLDLCVLPVGIVGQYANTPAGIRRLVNALRKLPLGRVVLEASGGYEEAALAALVAAALPVRRVNAKQPRAYALSQSQRAKTDKLDAQILAKFAAQDTGPLYVPPTVAEQQLQDLVSRRQQLVEQRVAEKQRRRAATLPAVRKSLDRVIRTLDQELAAIEKAIREVVAGDATLKAHDAQLQSVPGIGEVVSWTLLAFLPELGTLDPKALAALAGVAPYPRESGKWKGKRFILAGRAAVRRALYQAGHSGAFSNPVLQALYRRLNPDGKRHKTAVVACAHKLVHICHALLRDGTSWQAPQPAIAGAA